MSKKKTESDVLTFDAIDSKLPKIIGPATADVEVPALGGKVRLRKLNASEYITLTTRLAGHLNGEVATLTDQATIGATMLYVVAATAIDGDGKQIFSGERIDRLNANSDALAQLGMEALRFNGLLGDPVGNDQSTPSPNSA